MNFDKESKKQHFFGGGMGWGGWGANEKKICIRLFFVLRLYIKFQVSGLCGFHVLTQTKGEADR